jgi:hypothetical protein
VRAQLKAARAAQPPQVPAPPPSGQ